MEYIYAALILHSAGKEVTEDAVTKVMTAAGIAVDGSRVKALIAALDGVNIAEAIEKSAVAAVAAAPAAAASAGPGPARRSDSEFSSFVPPSNWFLYGYDESRGPFLHGCGRIRCSRLKSRTVDRLTQNRA